MINKIKNQKSKIKISQRQMGFTVLEAMIAIFILSLSVSGVFTAVQRSLSQSIISKDEVKAFYLAQEAIEIVRNKRDQNQLQRIINNSSITWLDGITEGGSPGCPVGRTCTIDPFNQAFVNCGMAWGSCSNLRYHPTAYVNGYDNSWTLSNFKRELQIESINANEIAITVQVSWTNAGITRQFKAKTHLFNWI